MTHSRTACRIGGAAGTAGFVLAIAGISAVGDAPDPHDAAAPLAAYFVDHRNAMFTSTALVAFAGVAVIIFAAVLCTRLADPITQRIAFVAAVGIVALLELNELIYACSRTRSHATMLQPRSRCSP